jgi:hypothetical protein
MAYSQDKIYTCKECFKAYKHFATLKNHILTKHPVSDVKNNTLTYVNSQQLTATNECSLIKPKINRPKVHKCKLCNEQFTTNYSLNRHIKSYCKEIKMNDNSITALNSTVFNDMYKLLLETVTINNKLLIEKQNTNNGMAQGGSNNNMTVNNTANDNHTENNITHNNNLFIKEIHINPLGSENLSHLTQDAIISILNQGTNAVPALAKAIMDIPENRNIVITDKRNKKATVVNRDGELEIMELRKALTMCTTDNIDRVDSYYESYKDQLPKQNKSLQRMVKAHGLESDSSDCEKEADDDNPHFDNYMDKIQNTLELNKKPSLARLNKYKEHSDQLTTARPINSAALTQS